MNYFELFGIPIAPSVDRSTLAKKYFELQKANHPDFFTKASEDEKEDALERSAAINKAFNTFQKPDKTLEYFLQLSGLIQADEKYTLPPDFLMEMMEINEEIGEDDNASVKHRVSDIEQELDAGVRSILTNYPTTNTDENQLLKLKDYYYKKKYLQRILDRFGD